MISIAKFQKLFERAFAQNIYEEWFEEIDKRSRFGTFFVSI